MAGVASMIGTLLTGGPKQKYTPVVAPPTPTPATAADSSVAAAGDAQRRLAGMSGGLQSTIKTSAEGAPDAGVTQFKSLLGG